MGLLKRIFGRKSVELIDTPDKLAQARRMAMIGIAAVVVLVVGISSLLKSGALTLQQFAGWTGMIVVGLAVVYFAYVISFVCRDSIERRRHRILSVLRIKLKY